MDALRHLVSLLFPDILEMGSQLPQLIIVFTNNSLLILFIRNILPQPDKLRWLATIIFKGNDGIVHPENTAVFGPITSFSSPDISAYNSAPHLFEELLVMDA